MQTAYYVLIVGKLKHISWFQPNPILNFYVYDNCYHK